MLKFSQKGFKITIMIKALVKKVNNGVTCRLMGILAER